MTYAKLRPDLKDSLIPCIGFGAIKETYIGLNPNSLFKVSQPEALNNEFYNTIIFDADPIHLIFVNSIDLEFVGESE